MKKPSPPGRPRGFDAGAALDAATEVFWLKGYNGASLESLTQAMGINRPSLYGAFGDKEALYLLAVNRYAETVVALVTAVLDDPHATRRCLLAMFSAAIAIYTEPAPAPRGCFLASAALEEAPDQPRLREAIDAALARLQGAVAAYLRRAGRSAAQAARQANVIVTFLYGLSARARLGAAAASLAADARWFVAALPES